MTGHRLHHHAPFWKLVGSPEDPPGRAAGHHRDRQFESEVLDAYSQAVVSDQGVKVVSVEPRGPADRAGVAENDIITLVNGRVVTSVDDLHRLLASLAPTGGIECSVVRGERSIVLEIEPGR